jgi:ribosome-binding protein aMBF1 (putative translation factor)
MTNGFTPQEDAEDLAIVLREARQMQGVSAWELAQRTGVRAEDVLEFEEARVVPAREQFAVYMRALGFEA